MSDDIIVDVRNGEIRKIIVVTGHLDDTFQTEVHLTISDEGIITDFVTSDGIEVLEVVGTIGNTWDELWDNIDAIPKEA